MKAVSVAGPLAVLQAKVQQQDANIQDLQSELCRLQLRHDEMQQQLNSAQQAAACRHSIAQAAEEKAHDMHNQLQTCQHENHFLQQQLAELQEHSRKSEAELVAKLTALQEQHAAVASELSLLQRMKQVTAEKLEAARKKLGLSEVEGRHFLQELDDASARCSALARERDQVAADCNTARQQLEARAKHCMALLEDNSRLRELTGNLKQQLAAAKIRQWQSTSHQPAAASNALRSSNCSYDALSNSSSRRRSSRTSRTASIKASTASSVDCGSGSMNRPAWSSSFCHAIKEEQQASALPQSIYRIKAVAAGGAARPRHRGQQSTTDSSQDGIMRQQLQACRQKQLLRDASPRTAAPHRGGLTSSCPDEQRCDDQAQLQAAVEQVQQLSSRAALQEALQLLRADGVDDQQHFSTTNDVL